MNKLRDIAWNMQAKSEKKVRIFSDRFLARRQRLNLTQTEMAKLLGISVRTIVSWEKGQNFPQPSQLRNISEKLQVSKEWLIGEDTPEITAPEHELLAESPVSPPALREPGGIYSIKPKRSENYPIPTPESCRQYLEDLLSKCGYDPAKVGWVLTQLKKHLPLDFFED